MDRGGGNEPQRHREERGSTEVGRCPTTRQRAYALCKPFSNRIPKDESPLAGVWGQRPHLCATSLLSVPLWLISPLAPQRRPAHG